MMQTIVLLSIMALVLLLPFLVRKVEEELEFFLFIMGLVAVSVTSLWSRHLLVEAFVEPLKITLAVLVAGLLFKVLQRTIASRINTLMSRMGLGLFVFLMVVILGLASSFMTAIIAALLLSEIVGHLRLDKENETKLVVISCFAIGFGAALMPIGEPLSTIVTAKLKGAPHHAGFWFLFKHLWIYIIPAIMALGILGVFMVRKGKQDRGFSVGKDEDFKDIFIRALKVQLFVMGLIFLGTGFLPLVDRFISKVPGWALYWCNIVSAIMDNATLAAAEMGPSLSIFQIKAGVLGLIVAGGMLIPGNIPNIVVSGKLKIRSKSWMKVGLPVGMVLMTVLFMVFLLGR